MAVLACERCREAGGYRGHGVEYHCEERAQSQPRTGVRALSLAVVGYVMPAALKVPGGGPGSWGPAAEGTGGLCTRA
jgi:hypothetical protein